MLDQPRDRFDHGEVRSNPLAGLIASAVFFLGTNAWGQPPPPPLAPPTPGYTGDTTINSGPLLGVGIGLTGMGLVGTFVGVGIAANSEETDPCYRDTCPTVKLGVRAAGLVTTFVSLALIGVGVPILLVGARQVPERRSAILPYVGERGLGFAW